MYLCSLVSTQFLEFLNCPWYEGDYYGNVLFVGVVVLLVVLLLLVGWLLFVTLWCHWLRAQFGNWHAYSAVLMCCSSCSSLSCEDETTLAL